MNEAPSHGDETRPGRLIGIGVRPRPRYQKQVAAKSPAKRSPRKKLEPKEKEEPEA